MTDTTDTTRTIRHYDWVPEWLGAPSTAREREAADDRAQEYLDEHEGDDLCIIVRRPRPGEAAGVYERADNGTLQILGYSVEAPEDVRELLDRAHQHALATWPATITKADPATVRAVAEAMVAADRGSRDCEPEVRDDPEAGDGVDWDDAVIGEIAVGIDSTIEDGEAWASRRRPAVLHAYAVAWRAAVAADLADDDADADDDDEYADDDDDDADDEYTVEVYDGDGAGYELDQYTETFTASSLEEAREKAREILDSAARDCTREDGYEDGERLLARLRLPDGSNEHLWLALGEEHLGKLPEPSPCVGHRVLYWNTERRAEAWWENLSYATGWDRDWSHPILGVGIDQIDAFDPEAAVPEEYAEALAAGGERAEDARDGLRAVAAYGRRAKRAALTIRAHIDAAIDACRRDDGDAMIEAMEAASAEERGDWGDDPFAREAADRLLAPGWSLTDGRVVRDDDADEDAA